MLQNWNLTTKPGNVSHEIFNTGLPNKTKKNAKKTQKNPVNLFKHEKKKNKVSHNLPSFFPFVVFIVTIYKNYSIW